MADDSRGAPFDPTDGDRTPSPEGIRKARRYMEHRFPAMRGAPLIEARVCQYEQSADGHLIVDTHPEAGNAWIAGGGSGHGYKLGPALGEMLAEQALGARDKEPFFGARAVRRSGGGTALRSASTGMSIEQHFDVPLIARMALREKQIQQSYRPIIGVHKWFARRREPCFAA